MIHVLIVDFHDWKKLQVAGLKCFIIWVSGAKFEETVKIIDIDYAESLICLPFKARSEYLQSLLIFLWVPNSGQEVFRESIVDELSLSVSNQELFLLEVEVELKNEVRGEEVRHARLLR